MKGITLCADCAYYSMKKHKCTRGAKDEGEATARFYADCPLDDVVSRGVLEQVRWERDVAMTQLHEHRIPFGGKAPDVLEVVRCKDCKYCDPENLHCDHTMGTTFPFPRKLDDYCSYGERKEK